ncbi:hypothetical protein BKA93DRAFT_340714 [Sparassis latifolia]
MVKKTAPEVYADSLRWHGHGLPLWAPELSNHGEVLVGDVGYIEGGGFYRLFNALHPADHNANAKFGVPEGFEPLEIPEAARIRRENIFMPGAYCSRSIRSSIVGGKIEVNTVGGGFEFKCSRDQRAVLVLKDSARSELVHESKKHFTRYMLRNYKKWTAFQHGVLDEATICVVYGWVKTAQWFVGAITQNGKSATVQFNGSFGPASAGIHVKVTREAYPQFLHRAGPPLSGTAVSSTDAQEEGSAKDQCIFVQYLKLKVTKFCGIDIGCLPVAV